MQSEVISTPLAGTEALQFIGQPLLQQGDLALAKPLQQNILDWANTRDEGLVKTRPTANALSLPETIQQLFQNATISMLSQTQLRLVNTMVRDDFGTLTLLRPNESSAFALGHVYQCSPALFLIYTDELLLDQSTSPMRFITTSMSIPKRNSGSRTGWQFSLLL